MSKSSEQVESAIERSGLAVSPPTELRDRVSHLIDRELRQATYWDDLKLIGLSLAAVLLVSLSMWVLFAVQTNQIRNELGMDGQQSSNSTAVSFEVLGRYASWPDPTQREPIQQT